ncbi:ribonuclease [Rhizobium sp. SEMIA 4085]|uniref:Ribonuclease T2 family protein n=1 Tax=Rhizobium gallicum bv. gallicum R602sp TaxID=1041138 RepID=A0A0B4X1N0_9HYPH|nr:MULTISPECIES: ribonuclease [Rhizobium]AJD41849.1 ribonuclease T2 family protein [Rhizobium gallicum bv. gallicum R602sp]NNH32733.1 ribonuclease [Rhizobium sp. SEMIA 4085]TDW31782.1 ribonuclease T2 [Rhizobium azibense]
MSRAFLRWRTFVLSMVLAGFAVAQEGEGGTRFILAASWQPAFCQTNQRKPECSSQTKERFDATNFSLHGLWPLRQNYCGVSKDLQAVDKDGDWQKLPKVKLTAENASALAKAMPGTQSGLERHEWTKHGTCTKMSADDYFGVAIRLMDDLNGSAVRDLFAANVGRTVKADQVKTAFDKSFGAGAGERVKMSCRRAGSVRVISELTIGLSEDAGSAAGAGAGLAKLMQDAGRTSFGCDEGVVDAAGF